MDGMITELEAASHRTAWLADRGFRIIRFRNQDLDDDIWTVVNEITSAIEELEAANPPSPTLPAEGRESEAND